MAKMKEFQTPQYPYTREEIAADHFFRSCCDYKDADIMEMDMDTLIDRYVGTCSGGAEVYDPHTRKVEYCGIQS